MIQSIFAHVVLKPHVHPEDILGVGVLCFALLVGYIVGKRGERGER